MKSLDTSREAHEIQLRIQRELGPAGRLELAIEMSEFACALREAGARQRRPSLDLGPAKLAAARARHGADQHT